MTPNRFKVRSRCGRGASAAIAVIAAVCLLASMAPAASATLPPPDPNDPAPALCAHQSETNPPGNKGYGLPVAFYFHNGILTDGALKVSNIQAAACALFTLPFTPPNADPSGYQPNPIQPILGATAPSNWVNLTPANDPGMLTLNNVPVADGFEGGTAQFFLQGPISAVVRQDTDPRDPGSLDLDIWATFSGIANVELLGITPAQATCPFLPVNASLSTTYQETAAGLAPTAPISGPLGEATGDIALAPVKLQSGPCSGPGGVPLPIVGQQISGFLNQTLLAGMANWSTPMVASLSLSAPAT